MSAVTRDRFASARSVADAVLYEGYVLYPYRASSRKNQVRFQWGVLTPRAFAAASADFVLVLIISLSCSAIAARM